MWHTLVRHTNRVVQSLFRLPGPDQSMAGSTELSKAPPREYRPVERLVLTDGVSRTLFEEFGEHRRSSRGHEETGWVLLGIRDSAEAVALATLPAGARREAGVAHVRFNETALAVGARMVMQKNRHLTLLGVVHTHPGSLRHPSDGDYQGDSKWVRQIKGKEGMFGIGTADASHPENDSMIALQPKPHVQCFNDLRMSWYALRDGDRRYRPLPVTLTLGPDLARPLHGVWSTIETHAEPLERLALQQARVTFELKTNEGEPVLIMTIRLAEPGHSIQVHLQGSEASYFVAQEGQVFAVDPDHSAIDRYVYELLAELAARA